MTQTNIYSLNPRESNDRDGPASHNNLCMYEYVFMCNVRAHIHVHLSVCQIIHTCVCNLYNYICNDVHMYIYVCAFKMNRYTCIYYYIDYMSW